MGRPRLNDWCGACAVGDGTSIAKTPRSVRGVFARHSNSVASYRFCSCRRVPVGPAVWDDCSVPALGVCRGHCSGAVMDDFPEPACLASVAADSLALVEGDCPVLVLVCSRDPGCRCRVAAVAGDFHRAADVTAADGPAVVAAGARSVAGTNNCAGDRRGGRGSSCSSRYRLRS
jgi:hypothetical protein